MAKAYKAGRGYDKRDWDAVSDNPKLTGEQMAGARPFAQALPKLAGSISGRRFEQGANEKTRVAAAVRRGDREIQGGRPGTAITDRSGPATDQPDQVNRP
jgi:hypothetical protein